MHVNRWSHKVVSLSICFAAGGGCEIDNTGSIDDDESVAMIVEVNEHLAVLAPPPDTRLTVEILYDDGHVVLIDVTADEDGKATLRYPDEELGLVAVPGATAACPDECTDDRMSLLGWYWPLPLAWSYNDAGRPAALDKTAVINALSHGALGAVSARNICDLPDDVDALRTYLGETTAEPNLVVDGNVIAPTGSDDENVLGWADLPNPVLGVAMTWSNQITGKAISTDMLFDSSVAWFTGNTAPAGCTSQYSLRGVATHEFGHAYGLGHSPGDSCNLTMYPSISACSSDERTLGLGDILGLESLYDFCPSEARYSSNPLGKVWCLFENIELPNAAASPYCTDLQNGNIGYSWTASPQTVGYMCPSGASYVSSGAGTDFCLFEDLPLPEAPVTPYCHYLELGYIGYSWWP